MLTESLLLVNAIRCILAPHLAVAPFRWHRIRQSKLTQTFRIGWSGINVASILVVDDMPDFRILVKKILSSDAIKVVEAATGIDAIKSLQENADIQLVLLDLGLPDIDGFSVAAEIQSLKQTRPELKVAIVTGSRDKSDVVKGLSLKVDDYIIKPVDPILLREKVNRLLKVEEPEITFAQAEVDFIATLVEIPISFSFHIRTVTEVGFTCESLNKFIVGANCAFCCEKLDVVIGQKEYVFRARIDSCEPLSRTSDRFLTTASFVGLPGAIDQKVRNFSMTFSTKK